MRTDAAPQSPRPDSGAIQAPACLAITEPGDRFVDARPPSAPLQPACHLGPATPTAVQTAPTSPWRAPLTACLRAVWWGVTSCVYLGTEFAQSLGACAHALRFWAQHVWPKPCDAAQLTAPLAAQATSAAEPLGAQTLALLRGDVSPQGAEVLSHKARAQLLRKYYPLANLIWALRKDAALLAVRERFAVHIAVPSDLHALKMAALGLAPVPHRTTQPLGALVCCMLERRVREQMRCASIAVCAPAAHIAVASIEGIAAWLASMRVPQASQTLARRLAGGDAAQAPRADAPASTPAATALLCAAFAARDATSRARAAEMRADALLAWARGAPASSAPQALVALSSAEAPCIAFSIAWLAPDVARCVCDALRNLGQLRLSAMFCAALVPDAWCCLQDDWQALGYTQAAIDQAHLAALAWRDCAPQTRAFVLADVLGGAPVWMMLDVRLGLAQSLVAPEKTAGCAALLRQATPLGAGYVARLAVQTVALHIACQSMTAQAARAQLNAWLAEGIATPSDMREAAATVGLLDGRLAQQAASDVLADEAAGDGPISAIAHALVFDTDPQATLETLLQALQDRLGVRTPGLDTIDANDAIDAADIGHTAVVDAPGAGQTHLAHALGAHAIIAGIRIDVAPPARVPDDPSERYVPLPQWPLVAACLRQGRAMLLEGPSGSGKTTLVAAMADRLGLVLHRLTLSPQTDEQDLLGRFVPGPDGGVQYVDGLLVRAMREGHIVLLDEANLAPSGLLERLNSVFDARRLFVETTGEHIVAHANFRCVLAANPASYAGRQVFSEALRSRLRLIVCPPLSPALLRQVLAEAAGTSVGDAVLDALVAAHGALTDPRASPLSRSAQGCITPRALLCVVRRLRTLWGADVSQQRQRALAAREFNEVYCGLVHDDKPLVARAVAACLGAAADTDLRAGLVQSSTHLALGDVRWPTPAVMPDTSAIVLTPRTKMVLYRMLKGMLAGESVALVGRRAGGKTALAGYAAALLGQPFVQQVLSAGTDASCLIGAFGPEGWRDGALLTLGRGDAEAGVLLLDEFNLAPSAMLERLNAVLDDARCLTLPEHDGEQVTLHKDFRIVCAMNPPGPKNPGRQRLSQALCTRLTWIEVGEAGADEQDSIAQGVARRLGCVQAAGLSAALRRFIESDLHSADRAQTSLRELCAAVHTFADLAPQMPTGDAFALALQAEFGAVGPVATSAEWWREAAMRAWPEAWLAGPKSRRV